MRSILTIAVLVAGGLSTAGAALAQEASGGTDSTAAVSGDAAAGEAVFRKCMACHAVGENARNKVGPVLNGVVGRQIAAVEDFSYSAVLEEMGAEGTMWSPEELDAFLEAPRDYAKGTKMAFPGLKDAADRENVIAYLASFEAG